MSAPREGVSSFDRTVEQTNRVCKTRICDAFPQKPSDALEQEKMPTAIREIPCQVNSDQHNGILK